MTNTELVIIVSTAVSGAMSLYAAILSTINWLDQRRKDRPRIDPVTGFSAVVVPNLPYIKGYAFDTFCSEAVNMGHLPVVIESQAFELPDNKWLIFHEAQELFPKRVEPGEKFTIEFEAETIKKELKYYGYCGKVPVKTIFKDQLGNIYTGKPKEFDMDRKCNGEGEGDDFAILKWALPHF